MVWWSQFKPESPRDIVSEIIDDKKMFVQLGLEEENRHYAVTMNNVISGSIRKKMCQSFGGCWTVVEKMPSQVFICNGNALTNIVADLQYFLNWWKLIVSFWSGAICIIFQICEPESGNKYVKYLNENQTCYVDSKCWKTATKWFPCACRGLILISSCNPKLVPILFTNQSKCIDICIFHNCGENSRS